MRAATLSRLRGEPDLEVVGEAEEPDEALRLVGERSPDVVVLDLRLGRSGQEGLDLAAEIGQRFPDVRIVVYSAYPTGKNAPTGSNIMGYVVKTDPPRMVVDAVRSAARGEQYRSPGWPT